MIGECSQLYLEFKTNLFVGSHTELTGIATVIAIATTVMTLTSAAEKERRNTVRDHIRAVDPPPMKEGGIESADATETMVAAIETTGTGAAGVVV